MARKRDVKTEYARRNDRAKALGFKSYAEQRKIRKQLAATPVGPGYVGEKEDALAIIAGPISASKSDRADYFRKLALAIDDTHEGWREYRKEYKRRMLAMGFKRVNGIWEKKVKR